jgi:hypothetical protein
VSRLASIFTCLLALLVASPLCCCAAEKAKQEESSCCCCGSGKKKEQKHDGCACAVNKVPREKMPDVALPAHPEVTLAPQPAAIWLPVVLQPEGELRPEWVPAIPWHAPPALRRALLVSRTL